MLKVDEGKEGMLGDEGAVVRFVLPVVGMEGGPGRERVAWDSFCVVSRSHIKLMEIDLAQNELTD